MLKQKKEEVNYKVHFIGKYLKKKFIKYTTYDVLNEVDICIRDKNQQILLYIESKYSIYNETDLRKALAQVILTNHKQQHILNKVALIYRDKENNDILKLVDCSDDSIMYNNDINWKQEKPSMPSFDAINRINDRLIGNIITYTNEEIKLFFDNLLNNNDIKINITLNNIQTIYNDWKNNITFKKEIKNEQDLINLFLVDILNGTKYKKKVATEIIGKKSINEMTIIREGIDLNKYKLIVNEEEARIEYDEEEIYKINDITKYKQLWKKYKRPPNEIEFFNIIERSAKLYTDKYRRTTGAEYTPSCFVELQNQMLDKYYGENWKNEYIVFDPCAGVGNLENDFGKEFKDNCYLSTLEKMDVDTCKIKGFYNVKEFDYLKDDKHPTFKYKGTEKSITEICELENKKLMVIMNPPYQRVKGKQNNLAIEFFNKVLTLNPQVIVFYYQTESFLRDELNNYINSKYKIVNHIFSDAETTFQLSNWPISQIIFDKDIGEQINKATIKTDRYELNYDGEKHYKNDKLYFVKSYTYNQEKPNLIKEIENKIKENQTGLVLGNYAYMSGTISLVNKKIEKNNYSITTNNLRYCLLHKGINFNTHVKYFERTYTVYRGKIEDISNELQNDAIMFSLFYKNNAFSNKSNNNYIMPYTSEELNCSKNDLYVWNLFKQQTTFDFREWLHKFEFSEEAKDLYISALKIFLYYHKTYKNTNFNDSFYDITNTIMGKNPTEFKDLQTENDTRINKTKTTKGTTGFSRNALLKENNEYISNEAIPIFRDFFDKRDILAKKINKQLLDSGLLLWERENIY